MNRSRLMGVSARAAGACLAVGCLVQGGGSPAPVEQAPAPAVKPAAPAAPRRVASKGKRIAEVVIRYCRS